MCVNEQRHSIDSKRPFFLFPISKFIQNFTQKSSGLTWRIEPPKIDSILFGFCHCVKFRDRVSVGFRVRVRVEFSVRIRVGIRVKVSLLCCIALNNFKTEKYKRQLIF